jgi:hypothetical protein
MWASGNHSAIALAILVTEYTNSATKMLQHNTPRPNLSTEILSHSRAHESKSCSIVHYSRMTGNPNLTPLLPTHIIRRGPKSDRSY